MNRKRFAEHTDDQIMAKRKEAICKSTEKSNRSAAETFRQYLKEKSQTEQFEEFDELRLAEALGHFYMDARTKTGELYKATSFENMRYGLNRHLQSPPHLKKYDIITSPAFQDANQCFRAALTEIKKSGKGVITHYAMITQNDLVATYQSIYLNPNTPSGLLNRVQMNIRLFFCRRANENMETMTIDTFKVCSYPDGTKYVMKQEDELTKNHRHKEELITAHMPEDKENVVVCPVATFELYVNKLNPNCNRLWQYPCDFFNENDPTSYQNRPIGRDTLAKFMSTLSKKIPLSQVYTNHCIRVTGASLLSQQNFSAAQIMSITGHKSVSSLAIYQRVTDNEKQAMGTVIRQALLPKSQALPLPAPPSRLALPSTSGSNPGGPTNNGIFRSNASYMLSTSDSQTSASYHAQSTVSIPATKGSSDCEQLEGINLNDLFSDFEAPLATLPTQKSMAPMFHGCTISNLTVNININK